MKNKPRDNPYDSDDFRRWVEDRRARLIPQMRDSATVLLIAPRMDGKFEIEFALQIGAAILLEKPLIVLSHPGCTIPPKLRAIADRIIETDLGNVSMDALSVQQQIKQAMDDFGKQ